MKAFTRLFSAIFIFSSLLLFPQISFTQNYAVDFDGSNDYITLGTSSTLKPTSYLTVEVFAYAANWSAFSTPATIVGNEEAWKGWAIKVRVTPAEIQGWVGRNGTLGTPGYALSSLSAGWHHFALTYDGRYSKFYVDGILVDTDDAGGTYSISEDASNGTLVGADVGTANVPSVSNPNRFAGRVDELRIWNATLSQTNIRDWIHRQITSSHPNYANLISYYTLDGNDQGDFIDEIGSNYGTAYNMDAATDWVESTAPVPFRTIANSNWNSASTWASNSIPNSDWAIATIVNNITVNSDMVVKNVTVNSGSTLTIQTEKSLAIRGTLTNNGSIVIEEVASLLDNGIISGTGTYQVDRPLTSSGWHYVSVPTSNRTANSFWNAALYGYDESTASWTAMRAGDNLISMKGYDAYYKTTSTVNFSGTPSTGNKSISVTYNASTGAGWNLVGNPYPSYIDWDASGWTKTNLNNALYVWDPSQSNVSTYIGGVGTNHGTRYIAPSQGFFVRTNTGGGTLGLSNTVRTHTTTTDAYFRSNKVNDLLILKINGNGYSDETAIRFDANATNNFDGNYDAFKVKGYNVATPEIYTFSADNEELSINTLEGLNQNVSVPLYVRVGSTGNYTISVNVSEFDRMTHIYLEDKKMGIIKDMHTNTLNSFYISVDEDPGRFVLHFTPLPVVENLSANETTNVSEEKTDAVYIYSYENEVYIDSRGKENATVSIYDMLGAEVIYRNLEVSEINKIILNTTGTYIVNVKDQSGSYTQKVNIK